MNWFISKLLNSVKKYIELSFPDFEHYKTFQHNVTTGKNVKLYNPVNLTNVTVGDYSYVGMYSKLKNVEIGKFCSIGPQCLIGWGIHPTTGISTAPMFYSTGRQNGMTLSKVDKIIEQKKITIGNDVFIGMNVTILDGVNIGHGAVIGAGAVVSKDIPAYAIAVGNPIQIVRYRFPPETIEQLLRLQWWNFSEAELAAVEQDFFDVEQFLKRMKK